MGEHAGTCVLFVKSVGVGYCGKCQGFQWGDENENVEVETTFNFSILS